MDDRADDLVSSDMYKRMMAGYEEELKTKESDLRVFNTRLFETQVLEENSKSLLESFRRHIYLDKLDREAVTELIDRIVVHKPIARGDKQIRNVEIFYNFVGAINSETK